MGQRSKVRQYPAELRAWLDQELLRRGFRDYVQLAVDLKRESEQLGKPVEASKSSLQRYGKDLERRMEIVKVATDAAYAFDAGAPDDADKRSAFVMGMVQADTIEVMVKLKEVDSEEDPAKRLKLLAQVATSIAKLSRASVNQKKHALELRDKARTAADAAAKIGKKGGLTKGAVDEIRREILGITG